MTNATKVTDYMIERAMSDPKSDPHEKARNVAILFARRIGRTLSEEEAEEYARHLEAYITLPRRRKGL